MIYTIYLIKNIVYLSYLSNRIKWNIVIHIYKTYYLYMIISFDVGEINLSVCIIKEKEKEKENN